MKKFILFLVVLLVIFLLAFGFTGGNEIIKRYQNNKTYNFTTKESRRLLRLPMYYQLKQEDIQEVVDNIYAFFSAEGN